MRITVAQSSGLILEMSSGILSTESALMLTGKTVCDMALLSCNT